MNTFRNHGIKLDIIWTDLDAAMFPAPTWLHLREDLHKLKWSPTHPICYLRPIAFAWMGIASTKHVISITWTFAT